MTAAEGSAGESRGKRARGGAGNPPIASLASLVGTHPSTLHRMFSLGTPTDPDELGPTPRGYFLTSDATASVFMLTRPLVKALGAHAPWRGKVFDHGGNSGQNVVGSRKLLRFRAEVGPSKLDGAPALVLRYDSPSFKNPWPVRDIVDELRTVAPGIALGPAFLPIRGKDRALLWFGLERV